MGSRREAGAPRRLAQTKRNDAGGVAGVPGGAPIPTGEGSATGVVVRAMGEQGVVRTPLGEVLPLLVEDDSRIEVQSR